MSGAVAMTQQLEWNSIVLVVDSTLRTTTTNQVPTPRRRLSTMSNLLRKRRSMTNETQIGLSSCTRSTRHRLRKLMDFRGQEAAAGRCGGGASGHRRGVGRCLWPSQIVLGTYQCTNQTPRSLFPLNGAATLLMHSSQEFKDIEEKIGDLVSWLAKLKRSITTTRAGDNRKDVECKCRSPIVDPIADNQTHISLITCR